MERRDCNQSEQLCAYALGTLPADEMTAVEAHLASCLDCACEFDSLRPVLDCFAAWPQDVLRPEASLQARLARRIAAESGGDPALPTTRQWREPQWGEVAPGISVKLLAADEDRQVVSMLVRLVPGGEYPPHTHAGREELHLLNGELCIDDRRLYPGDYSRAERGTGDQRVWSDTGCTCVLITSAGDTLV